VFGPALAARLVLVTVAAALGCYRVPSLAVASAAVLTQLELGHPAAAQDWLLPVGSALHVLGVGGWIGSLPALFVAFRTDRRAAWRYFRLGLWAVLALIAGGVAEAWDLVGGVPGLLGTPYGHVILLKSALLVLLLGCASTNRYVLGPALGGPRRAAAARGLSTLMGIAIMLGLVAIWLAATLSGMEPGAHAQPDWPLPFRLSLAALNEPDLAGEAWLGVAELVAALVLLAASLVVRGWWRLLPLVAAAVCGWLAWAHLDLLAVPATRYSFYASPSAGAPDSVAQGAALFPRYCASCHGALGHGNGEQAAGLEVPPANLTEAHVLEHPDGEMFGWLTDGIEGPDGTLVMPGFGAVLTADQRWALIDYARSLAGGKAASGGHIHHH
jgi:mono/diheme cytochrome c family protein